MPNILLGYIWGLGFWKTCRLLFVKGIFEELQLYSLAIIT